MRDEFITIKLKTIVMIAILICLISSISYCATPVKTVFLNHFDTTSVTDITFTRDWQFLYNATYNTPVIDNTIKKFGEGSLYCSANATVIDDYTFPYYIKGGVPLGDTTPFGDGDWTLEFFVYIKQRTPVAGNPSVFVPIYRDRNSYQSSAPATAYTRGFQIYTNINDTGAGNPVLVIRGLHITNPPYVATPIQKYISVTISQPYNTWHHVAVTKQITAPGFATYRFFWNGGLYGYIYSKTDNYPMDWLNDPTNWQILGGQLGGVYDAASTYDYNQCPMYFDEMRISHGCRYYTHFTPSTAEFEYPLYNNLTFKPTGEIKFKEDGEIKMKFGGGF